MMPSIMPLAVMLASASTMQPSASPPATAPGVQAPIAQALPSHAYGSDTPTEALAIAPLDDVGAPRVIRAQARADPDGSEAPPAESGQSDTAPPAASARAPGQARDTSQAKPDETGPAASAPVGRNTGRPTDVVSPTERRAILKAAAQALSRVETARGRFVQVDPAGRLTEGSFALKRPGRMRFDYDAPTPILIAADGATVAIRDAELETVDRVPLASTPLSLLLDDDLDFQTEADVTDVRKAGGLIAVSMRDSSGEADGELTLIFDAGSYDLVSWRTLDANGETTLVQLKDVRTGVRISPRAFIIEEFDDERDDRR